MPLPQTASFYTPEVIRLLAVSDEWFAIATTDHIVGVDRRTQKVLWSKPFAVFADSNSSFLFGGETLVAASLNEVLLIDRSGTARSLEMDGAAGRVVQLVAAYPSYVFLIREPLWTIEAYDLLEGRRLWTARAGRGGADVLLDPAERVAYVATRDHGLSALDNSTGNLIWMEDRGSLTSTMDDDTLFSASQTALGQLAFSAFDVKNREEAWHATVTQANEVYGLGVMGNLLVASGTGGLIALDKRTGALVWRTQLGESVLGRPAEFDGVIYARTPNQTLHAFSAQTGGALGSIQLDHATLLTHRYEARAGVYATSDGIVFNSRHQVLLYGAAP